MRKTLLASVFAALPVMGAFAQSAPYQNPVYIPNNYQPTSTYAGADTGDYLFTVQNNASVAFQVTGSPVGLVAAIQGSVDGTNFITLDAYPVTQGPSVTSITGTGAWRVITPGFFKLRFHITGHTSGTFAVTAVGAQASGVVSAAPNDGGSFVAGGPVNIDTSINGGTLDVASTSQIAIAGNSNRFGATIVNPPAAADQGLGTCTGFTIAVPGINDAPGDTFTVNGGVNTLPCSGRITATQVSTAFPIVVVSGGTGCTQNDQALVTGTTGVTNPGPKFQLSGNVSAGGVLTSITGITIPGSYTTNPTNTDAEPVTVLGCSVAPTIQLKMGGASAAVVNGGKYSNPIPPIGTSLSVTATSGSGTGDTWTTPFAGAPEFMYVALGRAATIGVVNNYCILSPGDTCPIDYNGHVYRGDVWVNALTSKHAWASSQVLKP